MRVIDEDGQQLGVLSKKAALELASEKGLDLIEVSPNADPPVAKIVDWGKYNYQRTKQLQKQKRTSKASELKQMRFGLDEGHKVKITIFYRGREMAHKDIGFQLANRVIDQYGNDIVVEQTPQLNGKHLIFVIRASGSARKEVKENTDA